MELRSCDETCAIFTTCTNKIGDLISIPMEKFIDDMYDLLIAGYSDEAVRALIEIELNNPDTSVLVDRTYTRLGKILSELQ